MRLCTYTQWKKKTGRKERQKKEEKPNETEDPYENTTYIIFYLKYICIFLLWGRKKIISSFVLYYHPSIIFSSHAFFMLHNAEEKFAKIYLSQEKLITIKLEARKALKDLSLTKSLSHRKFQFSLQIFTYVFF